LAVEVDGDIHVEKTAHDRERSEWLDSQKQIRVLRVTNQDVIENIEGVMKYILQELASAPSLPSPVKKTA
jgi:very-short-patch-repair endonuclease